MKVIHMLAKVNAKVSKNLSDKIGLHSQGGHCGEEGDLELSVDELAGLPVEHHDDDGGVPRLITSQQTC